MEEKELDNFGRPSFAKVSFVVLGSVLLGMMSQNPIVNRHLEGWTGKWADTLKLGAFVGWGAMTTHLLREDKNSIFASSHTSRLDAERQLPSSDSRTR